MAKRMKDSLSEKEKFFCTYLAEACTPKEAAIRSGYKIRPEWSAINLLQRKDIKKEIARIADARRKPSDEAKAGFRRLAFGGISDAVRLIYTDEPNFAELDAMDLFCVSEIKRPKNGGMEIKFFDRQKALERLSDMDETDEKNTAVPFYKALEEGARRIERDGEDGN